jgi:hypothetical protein
MEQTDTYEIIHKILTAKEASKEKVKEALQSVLIESVEAFKAIDVYQRQFVDKNEVRAPQFYYEAQDALSGYYMYLSPIVMVLTALKEVRSNSYFHSVRVSFEKNPPLKKNDKGFEVHEKFVSAPVEKESQEHVSEETYIAAVFIGYLDACRTAIQTCRNRTKSYEEETRTSRTQT